MKRIAVAVLLASLAAVPAAAQAPAAASEVPKMKCEPKPEFPGRLAMQSDSRRRTYERELKGYQQCVTAYVEERKAVIKANESAAQAAIEEHNAIVKKIQDDQKAASQ